MGLMYWYCYSWRFISKKTLRVREYGRIRSSKGIIFIGMDIKA
jgi:hypothetical protein